MFPNCRLFAVFRRCMRLRLFWGVLFSFLLSFSLLGCSSDHNKARSIRILLFINLSITWVVVKDVWMGGMKTKLLFFPFFLCWEDCFMVWPEWICRGFGYVVFVDVVCPVIAVCSFLCILLGFCQSPMSSESTRSRSTAYWYFVLWHLTPSSDNLDLS